MAAYAKCRLILWETKNDVKCAQPYFTKKTKHTITTIFSTNIAYGMKMKKNAKGLYLKDIIVQQKQLRLQRREVLK